MALDILNLFGGLPEIDSYAMEKGLYMTPLKTSNSENEKKKQT